MTRRRWMGVNLLMASYVPGYREGISKTQLSQLRAQYPEIYRDFADVTEYRTFDVKKSSL